MKCLAQGNNILLPGFEPSTSVSKTDILANRPICSNVALYTYSPDCFSYEFIIHIKIPSGWEFSYVQHDDRLCFHLLLVKYLCKHIFFLPDRYY